MGVYVTASGTLSYGTYVTRQTGNIVIDITDPYSAIVNISMDGLESVCIAIKDVVYEITYSGVRTGKPWWKFNYAPENFPKVTLVPVSIPVTDPKVLLSIVPTEVNKLYVQMKQFTYTKGDNGSDLVKDLPIWWTIQIGQDGQFEAVLDYSSYTRNWQHLVLYWLGVAVTAILIVGGTVVLAWFYRDLLLPILTKGFNDIREYINNLLK